MREKPKKRKVFFSHRKRARSLQGLVAGLVVGLVVSLVHLGGGLERFESLMGDIRRVGFSSELPRTNTVHINVTQSCLASLHEGLGLAWPWPRESWAIITDYLHQAGAKTIIFDLLFTEFSSSGVEDDLTLVKAISNSKACVFSAMFSQPLDSDQSGLILSNRDYQVERAGPIAEFSLPIQVEKGARLTPYAYLESYPYHEYLPHIAGLGNVHLESDSDSIVRRKRLAFDHYGRAFLDLALAGIAQSHGVNSLKLSPGRLELHNPEGKFRSIPLDKNGNLVLNFADAFAKNYNPERHNYFTAAQVLATSLDPESESEVKPDYFKDKIVLIGTDAPGLKDIRANPFGNSDGGVYLYSTVIENILSESYLVEFYESWFSILLIFFFSALTGYLGGRLSVVKGLLACLGLVLLYDEIAFLLFSESRVIIELAGILTAIIASYMVSTFLNYYLENRQKQFVQGAFSQVLAPAILEKLLDDPSSLTLGGDSKELTIFFSDLAGFTTLSEALGNPQRLVSILNEYLTAMADIIMDYDGYVDKYEGDAIMAFWGAPIDDPEHAWKACHAALDNQTKLTELQARFIALGLPGGLSVRIGLNTGVAVAGMMGSLKKLNYTIIGDPVNLASRLEGANKQYGSKIMISESTRLAAGEKIITRPLDLIRVKGKTEPTSVHELVAKADSVNQQQLELIGVFSQALTAYRECRFEEARAGFQMALKILADDPPSLVYTERCDHYLKHPPPSDWDGVHSMTSK